jgi:hypothetical protein
MAIEKESQFFAFSIASRFKSSQCLEINSFLKN